MIISANRKKGRKPRNNSETDTPDDPQKVEMLVELALTNLENPLQQLTNTETRGRGNRTLLSKFI